MSTLTEIESPVIRLPGAEQAELLRFVAANLHELAPTAPRTGAELARLWAALPHLDEDEAAAFESDLAATRASEYPQDAPSRE